MSQFKLLFHITFINLKLLKMEQIGLKPVNYLFIHTLMIRRIHYQVNMCWLILLNLMN